MVDWIAENFRLLAVVALLVITIMQQFALAALSDELHKRSKRR